MSFYTLQIHILLSSFQATSLLAYSLIHGAFPRFRQPAKTRILLTDTVLKGSTVLSGSFYGMYMIRISKHTSPIPAAIQGTPRPHPCT